MRILKQNTNHTNTDNNHKITNNHNNHRDNHRDNHNVHINHQDTLSDIRGHVTTTCRNTRR